MTVEPSSAAEQAHARQTAHAEDLDALQCRVLDVVEQPDVDHAVGGHEVIADQAYAAADLGEGIDACLDNDAVDLDVHDPLPGCGDAAEQLGPEEAKLDFGPSVDREGPGHLVAPDCVVAFALEDRQGHRARHSRVGDVGHAYARAEDVVRPGGAVRRRARGGVDGPVGVRAVDRSYLRAADVHPVDGTPRRSCLGDVEGEVLGDRRVDTIVDLDGHHVAPRVVQIGGEVDQTSGVDGHPSRDVTRQRIAERVAGIDVVGDHTQRERIALGHGLIGDRVNRRRRVGRGGRDLDDLDRLGVGVVGDVDELDVESIAVGGHHIVGDETCGRTDRAVGVDGGVGQDSVDHDVVLACARGGHTVEDLRVTDAHLDDAARGGRDVPQHLRCRSRIPAFRLEHVDGCRSRNGRIGDVGYRHTAARRGQEDVAATGNKFRERVGVGVGRPVGPGIEGRDVRCGSTHVDPAQHGSGIGLGDVEGEVLGDRRVDTIVDLDGHHVAPRVVQIGGEVDQTSGVDGHPSRDVTRQRIAERVAGIDVVGDHTQRERIALGHGLIGDRVNRRRRVGRGGRDLDDLDALDGRVLRHVDELDIEGGRHPPRVSSIA